MLKMEVTMRVLLILAALTGCGSDFDNCRLGALTGAWRIHYTHVDGTCGDLPDETVVFEPGQPSPCTIESNQLSPDLCELDAAWTCPVTATATAHWAVHFEQTGDERIEGTGTLDARDGAAGCTSTYDFTIVKL